MALKLPMADAPRYQVALGDLVPEALPGLRLLPLARPDTTLAAVRYVQLPLWREWGIRAHHVSLSVGTADLLATWGEETTLAAAFPTLLDHAAAVAEGVGALLVPGATLQIIPCTAFAGWGGQDRFNAEIARIFGAAEHWHGFCE